MGGRRGGGLRLPRPRRPLPVLQPPPLRQGHPRQVARAQCSVASVHYYRRYCREFPLVLPPPSAAWPGLFLVTASHPSLGYSEASLVIETLRQYLSPVLTVCVQVAPPVGQTQDAVHHRGTVPPHPGGADRGPAIAGGANDFNAHKYILI